MNPESTIATGEQSVPSATPARSFIGRLAGYFRGARGWVPCLLGAGILLSVVCQVAIQLRINGWQAAFFDSLEKRAIDAFVAQIGIFGLLAAASMTVSVTQLDLKMRLQLGWRRWLSDRIVGTWMADARHYGLGFVPGDHANADQRIAEDVRVVTEIIVDFATGIMNALLMLICFVGVLWTLSSGLTLPIAGGIHIEGYMVWAALLYAAIGTGLTSLVGRPLAERAAAKLAAEGEYRSQLVRAREHSEGIALMRGEADERRVLSQIFEGLADRWSALRRGICRVAWLTTGYSLMGIIFPTLVASPMYLAGEISLGGLMQAVAAMVHVQTALSWFVDNFPRISELRASAARVTTLMDALDDIDGDASAPEDERIVIRQGETPDLQLLGLDIAFPDGSIVIAGAKATIKPGEKVLIVGESGSGKSMLLRAVAGVWPWGRGTIELPREGRFMFMPQRPYFPSGSLGAALAYPLDSGAFPEEAYRAVLDRCALGGLTTRLRESDRWDQVLSGGEQQRLAFARVLLHQPSWVFLDEATSALDEVNQDDMMRLFRDELAAAAVVSIGHRPGLEKLHDRTMSLVKGDESAKLVRGLRRTRATRRDGDRFMTEKMRRSILARLGQIAARSWRRRSVPPSDAPKK